jgi:uncharacterized protein (DUF1499 family)
MSQTFPTFPTPFARWSRIVAVFAVQMILLGVLLHRFTSLPTPVALNLFKAAVVCATIALALGFIAIVVIWRRGRSGSWAAATGVIVGLAIFAWPLAYLPFALKLPAINDVTTDPIAPPRFITLAKMRAKDANRVDYGGAPVAKLQVDHYSDLKPVVIQRPITEMFDIVGVVARRLKWTVVTQEPAQGRGRPGYIEAVSRTLIIGFYDDVVVRLDGDQKETRIDIRSASRYGTHDLGRNASRVRGFYRELQAQLDSSLPGGERRRRRRGPLDAVPKRQKGAPVASQAQPTARGQAQPAAQRGLQPKEKLRPKGEARARDKQ